MKINTFDIDGVIYFGEGITGVRPCDGDIIITGRPIAEEKETINYLEYFDAKNIKYFGNLKYCSTLQNVDSFKNIVS